jgi:formate hydrogenlyase transcriptional activator
MMCAASLGVQTKRMGYNSLSRLPWYFFLNCRSAERGLKRKGSEIVNGEHSRKLTVLDSNLLFEKLFEFSPDAVLIADHEGTILRANQQTETMFGHARTNLIGRPVELLVPERFRSGHSRHRNAYAAQPHTRPMGVGLDLFGLRKDGTEFPVDIMLSPVRVEEQSLVLAVVRDITRRRTAEQERDLQAKLAREQAALLELAHDSIIVRDLDNRITFWSRGAEEQYGWKREEVLGKHAHTLLETQFPQSAESVDEALRSDHYWEGEVAHKTKDGDRIVVASRRVLQIDAEGKPAAIFEINNDVTDRKKTEEALRRSEQRFRSLFEFSPDAIVVTNPNGKIADANAQLEQFFGYSRSELVGQLIEVLIPERFRVAHPKHRSDYMAGPRVRSMGAGLELYGRRKDGTEFPVDVMLGPLEGTEGALVLGVIRDLSQKKKDEEALRLSQQQKLYLEEELQIGHQFDEIVGESPGLKRVLKQVKDVASTDATVLILGETGTGKELIARAIHRLSPRRDHAFVKLNCSAIPSGLLESELFGHEKGAFTGAIAQKIGRLELAHQGTFFLDEVGDLPPELQPKILRALQEKEFERVGGTRTIPVNVRLVAATNRDLAKMVAAGQFRSDLYYRLKVFPVTLPSLRERREDIPLLVRYFLNSHSKRMGKRIETIPPETMQALVNWRWPGNIRELENFLERSVILSSGPTLRSPLAELQAAADPGGATDANLESAERDHILRILRECQGMIGGPGGAAERLGLKRTTLNSKMKKLGIQRRDYI